MGSVLLAPDGRYIVSGSGDMTVRLWETETGKELRRFDDASMRFLSWIWAVAFSPDGRQVASGGHDTTVRIFETETGKEIKHFDGHQQAITSLSFWPNGRYLASGSKDGTVRLWDLKNDKEVRRFWDIGADFVRILLFFARREVHRFRQQKVGPRSRTL